MADADRDGGDRRGDEPPAGPAAPLHVVEGGRRRWLAVGVVVALLVAGLVAGLTDRADGATVASRRGSGVVAQR